MHKFKLTRRIIIGLAFIYLAGLGWLAELIIPFTSISHKGAIWVTVLVGSEILFLVGVAVLGKPVYEELKRRLMDYLRRPKP